MSILIGIAGLLVSALGLLFLIGCLMPTFGGQRNDIGQMAVIGGVLLAIGLGLIFYAGTWL